jgi:ParB family chromosome partitioning protein
MILVSNIHPNPNNPRKEAGNVTELARQIKDRVDQGLPALVQPIMVIPAPQYGGDHVMIEDGYRRWVAGKSVVRALECTVNYPRPDEDLTRRALSIGLVTALHKMDLTPLEKADAFGRLHKEFGMTQDAIGKQFGITGSSVGYYMALLDLSDKSRGDVASGKLSADRAISAVREHRSKNRKKSGKKPIDVGWEPDHFSDSHYLAKNAKVMCDARGHGSRRRFAGACHACWETVIRRDENQVTKVDFLTAGSKELQFMPPAPLENGVAGVNGTTGNHK